MFQRTLQTEVKFKGKGLHTGKNTQITLLPTKGNHGIIFQRIDVEGQPSILADVNNVSSTTKNTTISKGGVEIHTIEHLMAALSALGVDNVLIQIDGDEVPILDGTATPFYDGIKSAGVQDLEEEKEVLLITEPMQYEDEETGSKIMVLPSDAFEVTAMVDFDSQVLGKQYANYDKTIDFEKEIAPARTFVFLHQLAHLLEHDLIKGGSLDNAVVVVENIPAQTELDEIAKALGAKDVKVEAEGILNKGGLKFYNEPARHKVLDIIGDLALMGKVIQGKIIITKPSHKVNVDLAKKFKAMFRKQKKLKGIPAYNPMEKPVLDVVEITKRLPHRFPFLLVDKIIELTDNSVVGVKNVTFNERYFQGHFPNNPVMPGVLQIEAMAQTGGILALSTVPDPENWDTYFLKIDNARFKKKVVPGDTCIFKLELTKPIRRGIVCMNAVTYVAGEIASEAELTAQIIRREVE